jgi:5'-nucleotidase
LINLRPHRFFTLLIVSTLSSSLTYPAYALNILLTNDDGLTSNIISLYAALKNRNHDIIVSVPCHAQSGMGGAIKFLKPITRLDKSCIQNAANAGDPGVGPFTKSSATDEFKEFYYVDGTPIMATAYGIDILALKRWGKKPDIVISGPNEGRNAGPIIQSSGTVNNVLFAANRGIPAIAVSAGLNTKTNLDSSENIQARDIRSTIAAQIAQFLDSMISVRNGLLTFDSIAPLNINFPDKPKATTSWKQSKVGNYSEYQLLFTENLTLGTETSDVAVGASSWPGLNILSINAGPTQDQMNDEGYISLSHISVSTLHPSFEPAVEQQSWLSALIKQMNLRSKK